MRAVRRTGPLLLCGLTSLLVAGCGASTRSPGVTPTTPPATSSATSAAPPTAAVGQQGAVAGVVRVGPVSPVQRVGEPGTRPAGGITVQLLQAGRSVTSAVSDAAGGFRLAAPPGDYTLRARGVDGLRSEASAAVAVSAGRTSTADLLLDTGIR